MIGGLISSATGVIDVAVSGGDDINKSFKTFFPMLDGDRRDADVMLIHVKMNRLFKGFMQRGLGKGPTYVTGVR